MIIEASGQVTIHIGASPHGQGTETTFSQMAADELGLTPEDMTILHSDTGIIAKGGGHFRKPGNGGIGVGHGAGVCVKRGRRWDA